MNIILRKEGIVSNVSVYRVGEDYLNEKVVTTFTRKRKDKKGVSHEFKFIVTVDKDDKSYLRCEVDGKESIGSLCLSHDWSKERLLESFRSLLGKRVEEEIESHMRGFNMPYPHKRLFKYLCLHFRSYHEDVEIVKSEEHFDELFKYYYTNKKLYEDVFIGEVKEEKKDTRIDSEIISDLYYKK